MPVSANPSATPHDAGRTAGFAPGVPLGLIEGFYGTPWSWQQRAEVMAFCAQRGMTHYVYAPKDDPLHRSAWRTPYGSADLAGFESLVAAGTLEVGFAVSPGLSIDYHDDTDLRALIAKFTQLVDRGVRLVVLALDDIEPHQGLGAMHARLANAVVDAVGDRAAVVLVPTDYTSVRPTAYLDELAAGLDAPVAVAWTGPTVVCDEITVDDVAGRTAALGGRAPLVWDNFPVNDAVMADQLFTGPLRGRHPDVRARCAGWLANPGVQPRVSLPALASVASWACTADPGAGWRSAFDDPGLHGSRTFAEACDAGVPGALVDAVMDQWPHGPLGELAAWMDDAARCDAGAMGADDVAAWVSQVRAEAAVGQVACSLLADLVELAAGPPRRPRPEVTGKAMALAVTWPAARRSPATVFGPRCSFRPVLAQHDDGTWAYDRRSLTTDANVIDRLVRFALDRLADTG